MTQPMVSVIMPAYNGAQTIKESLDSVLAQTYSAYEIIVVDDASTDATPALLEKYKSRIKLIRREKNSGICEVARSEGIKSSLGQYCAFIDQDDLWAPGKLEAQVAFMEAHPEFPLSHHYVRVIDGSGAELEIRHDGFIPKSGPCAEALLRHCFITISAIMIRGKLWMEAGDPLKATSPNTDIEYFLKLLRRYPCGFGFIPEVLGSYRRWPASLSRGRWRWCPKDVDALERAYISNDWHGLLSRRQFRRLLGEAYYINAHYHQQQGSSGRALYFTRHGFGYHRSDPRWLPVAAKALWRGMCGNGFSVDSSIQA